MQGQSENVYQSVVIPAKAGIHSCSIKISENINQTESWPSRDDNLVSESQLLWHNLDL